MTDYPVLSARALGYLIQFPSTYLCEAAFSSMVATKTKYRNRLFLEDDLRCSLSATKPRFAELADRKQKHTSHWVYLFQFHWQQNSWFLVYFIHHVSIIFYGILLIQYEFGKESFIITKLKSANFPTIYYIKFSAIVVWSKMTESVNNLIFSNSSICNGKKM